MGLLTSRLSFEFCSSAIKIVKDGKLVLSEKALIALDNSNKIVATGDSVDINKHENVIAPVKGGIITDFNAFEMMLRSLIRKALGKTGKGIFMPSLKTCCLIPDYSTEVEIRAVRDSMEHAGAREVYMIYSSHAIMESLKLHHIEPLLLIDCGAGKISFSVLSEQWIQGTSKLDFGADKLKQIIRSYILKHHRLLSDDDSLNSILHNYMTFQGIPKAEAIRINGIGDNNKIHSFEVDLTIINKLLLPYFNIVLNETQLIMDSFKNKMHKQIKQIMILGGLSKLNGFEKGISDFTGISVMNRSVSSYTTDGLFKLDKVFEKYKYALR